MPSLDEISVLLVWTAVAIYALAFVAYTIDLASRSAQALDAKDAAALTRERQLVGAAAGAAASARSSSARGETKRPAGAVNRSIDSSPSPFAIAPAERVRPLFARIGTSLVWLGFLFHLGADVLRGVAAGRVPWANMYEFALTGMLLVVAVYLAVLFRYDLRFLGALVTGLVVLLLGGSVLAFYVVVAPLVDPLKSPWLVIHVFVASLATAFFTLTFGLSLLQLMQTRREHKLIVADGKPVRTWGFLKTLPSSEALESLAYRFAIVGFIFWTFTLIAGSIWANDAWGRFWGFDTKEVWTFVIWVLYAGYIHARATRGWRGTRSAWLSVIGFAAVIFNFAIVNVFFKGLHAYSGLTN
ncbi:c-type cytochrome biogenesis protein CcsB [Microbacterium terrisoli]|jgi:cytochrome c-type biogenesis protein CcsB|uniref:c-type cytochrome biogenesis protein CcsB n=1 Tax=Microbacterium terrisoli TaxID=3242192 RepID=UPI0028037671|nr:c-type cytochrome biogenesis protein CcsB [Microbacterium protaetiae]